MKGKENNKVIKFDTVGACYEAKIVVVAVCLFFLKRESVKIAGEKKIFFRKRIVVKSLTNKRNNRWNHQQKSVGRFLINDWNVLCRKGAIRKHSE